MQIWLRAALYAALHAGGLAVQGADAGSVTLLDKPVTATVALPLGARGAKALLLQLEHVVPPQEGSATFNIFAELPTADANTTLDHLSFVGYVTLMASPSAPAKPARGITLQVADPAARTIERMRSARLTFVPAAKFAGKGVRIGSVRLEAVAK